MKVKFPSSFLWGAAISSYQCEGGNYNCDWYLWEKQRKLEPAGGACNHYNLFERDFELARGLNLNSLRFSIEWARVSPHSREFSQEEIAHYVRVVDTLLSLNIKPVVTLHHFTNPIWFYEAKGWAHPANVDYFLAYLKEVVEALKDKVDTWLIFNEPFVYIYNSFIQGIWPPGDKSLRTAKKVLDNITAAYLTGYQEIKRIYRQSALKPEVSLAKNVRVFSGCPNALFALNSLSAFVRSKSFNFRYLDYLNKKRSLDFIALNYYAKEYNRFKGFMGAECKLKHHKERQNYLGWNVYAKGFYDILMKVKRFNLPVVITENGTPETDDYLYENFLTAHLQSMAKALLKGVNIRGYHWWSLLDNFEWDKGFGPRFGLIEVDYKTFKRQIKPFARVYAKVCGENKVDI